MMRISTFMLAFGLATPGMLYAASPQNPQPTERPVFGPLSADQVSRIQGVGRAVLAAKGSQQSSAEELALLNELHNLSASVDQALKFTPTAPSLSVSVAPESAQSGNAGSTRQDKLNTQLTPALDRLRQVRQGIDAMSSGDEATQTQIAHVQRLSTQAGHLEQAVRDALSVTDDADRYAQLAQINQRLRSRTMGELLQDKKKKDKQQAISAGKAYVASPETPTLTTLTQHRQGLDDLRTGKH